MEPNNKARGTAQKKRKIAPSKKKKRTEEEWGCGLSKVRLFTHHKTPTAGKPTLNGPSQEAVRAQCKKSRNIQPRKTVPEMIRMGELPAKNERDSVGKETKAARQKKSNKKENKRTPCNPKFIHAENQSKDNEGNRTSQVQRRMR